MIIDVHSHAMDEALLGALADDPSHGFTSVIGRAPGGAYRWAPYGLIDPPLYRLDLRLASLDRRGVDHQLVGMWPPFLNGPSGGASVAFARLANACLDRVARASAGRLSGLAVVAFGEPDRMVEELERTVDRYGFRGVMIGTSVNGIPLDDDRHLPIFAAIERLGLLVFMHANGGFDRPALADFSMRVLVGFPGETSLAVGRLLFRGVFHRHPDLKLVLSHGGGTLPYLRGRLDLGYRASTYERNDDCTRYIDRPPSAYLARLYYDTLVADPDVLEFLLRSVGPTRVLFGTDYPFEIGDPEGAYALRAIARLPDDARALVLGGNAARLLQVPARA